MLAPKQKLKITVVPVRASSRNVSADDVALLLARLIGRQIAREQTARSKGTKRPSPVRSSR